MKEMNEYEHQVKIFELVEIYKKQYPELILLKGDLQGVRLHIGSRMKMKRAGCLNPGFPDIQLPVPCGRYKGLFIELKKPKGKVSDEQKKWLAVLNGYGYKATVSYGYQEAWDEIISYLNEKAKPA